MVFFEVSILINRKIQISVIIVNSKETPRRTIANGAVFGKYELINAKSPVIIAIIGIIAAYKNLPGIFASRVIRIANIANIAAKKNEAILIQAFATFDKMSLPTTTSMLITENMINPKAATDATMNIIQTMTSC